MERKPSRLSNRKIERLIAARRDGELNDGNGLHLRKRGSSATWSRRIGDTGRVTLGAWPDMKVEGARVESAKVGQSYRAGKPLPIVQRRAKVVTFADVAREFIPDKVKDRNPRHADVYYTTLLGEHADGRKAGKHHCAPIASLPIGAVSLDGIANLLRPIWPSPTATRLRERLEGVFDFARVKGFVPAGHANPARWAGDLEHALPAITHKVAGHAMVPWQAAPAFVEALRAREGVEARALELVAYSGLRTGAVRRLRVRDIDFAAGVFTAFETKTDVTLAVPMAPTVVALLRAAVAGKAPDDQVFLTAETALRHLMRKMVEDKVAGVEAATVHGWRSTLSTWVGDCGLDREATETALSHKRKGVEGVYNRAPMVGRRRAVLAAWANHLDGKNASEGNVVPMSRAAH